MAKNKTEEKAFWPEIEAIYFFEILKKRKTIKKNLEKFRKRLEKRQKVW